MTKKFRMTHAVLILVIALFLIPTYWFLTERNAAPTVQTGLAETGKFKGGVYGVFVTNGKPDRFTWNKTYNLAPKHTILALYSVSIYNWSVGYPSYQDGIFRIHLPTAKFDSIDVGKVYDDGHLLWNYEISPEIKAEMEDKYPGGYATFANDFDFVVRDLSKIYTQLRLRAFQELEIDK